MIGCRICATGMGLCSAHRSGEQSPTAEEREIDRLRAEVRALGEKKLALKNEVSDLIGKLTTAVSAEREACAKLLEDSAAHARGFIGFPGVVGNTARVAATTAASLAAAIRARGGK